MLAVAAVLTACTNEDNFTNEQLPNTGNEARTFTVNIPASMGEGAQTRSVTFNNDATPPTATGSFNASEPVYVYNETKKALLSGELRPTDISADGKSCNLTGTLTGSFDAGDKLTLLYNMIYDTDPAECIFWYGGQDGSESGVVDGGMATGVSATISGSTLTTATTVTFAMQQAIFRLKFTDGTNPINVKSLIIKCTGSDVASCYSPFNDIKYETQSISVTPTTPTSDYLYVALGINENASPSGLTFTVTDDDGDVYTATKAAPTSGFKNGKYYYSSDATVLTWQTKLVKPTITNITNLDYAGEFGPDPIGNSYYLLPVNVENPLEITISGTSNGYWFLADGGNAIIHLNNLTATHDSNYFISAANLTLDISGTNTITCKTENQAISSNGTLKLKGNGTLTVTANASYHYGLYAETNYENSNNSDASVLAAPGYTVTRSDMTDNLDGTYTWTYTVTPKPLSAATAEDIGKVVCADGHLHDAKTAVPTGCTAVGILGKVTETGHGLILALQDATQQKWNITSNTTINGWTSVTTYASTTLKQLPANKLGSLTSYTTLGSTTVSNWCLAQKSDYEAIFINLGSAKYDSNGYTYDANVNAYITTGVGGTAISESEFDRYLSATEDGSYVWASSSDYWNLSSKSSTCSLRPVLGF